MEDVLETDSRDFDTDEVLVCLIVNDETARQQTKETRTPLPTRPGPVPASRGLMTSRMNATVPPTCSCSVRPWRVGGLLK